MSDDYRITLAGAVPPLELLQRVSSCLPQPLPPGEESKDGVFIALRETFGSYLFFQVPEENGFVGALADDGEWDWELPISTTLWITTYEFTEQNVENVLSVVAHLLNTGDEDLAFTFNGNYLYLIREGGVVAKHNRSRWWDFHPGLGDIVPG